MDRKEYTPTKQSALMGGGAREVGRGGELGLARGGQLSIVREYETLRAQARQLEMQNRQLAGEVDKLRYQKNAHENKLLQKASFEEEAIAHMQKEKNYQLEMLRIKNEEDLNRARREYQLKVDDLLREVRNRQALNKDLADKNAFVQGRVGELRSMLGSLEGELVRLRDGNSIRSEQLTKEEFANKKLEMLKEQLECQRNEMQAEIHVLLDIQAEKSNNISTLEAQLAASSNSEQALQQKLAQLTQNFLTLEEHIAIMKERLGAADFRGEELDRQLQQLDYLIAERDQVILEQREREVRLRGELEGHRERQGRRVQQVQHLMGENQRAYRELVGVRHRLFDVSIEQGLDL